MFRLEDEDASHLLSILIFITERGGGGESPSIKVVMSGLGFKDHPYFRLYIESRDP